MNKYRLKDNAMEFIDKGYSIEVRSGCLGKDREITLKSKTSCFKVRYSEGGVFNIAMFHPSGHLVYLDEDGYNELKSILKEP